MLIVSPHTMNFFCDFQEWASLMTSSWTPPDVALTMKTPCPGWKSAPVHQAMLDSSASHARQDTSVILPSVGRLPRVCRASATTTVTCVIQILVSYWLSDAKYRTMLGV